MSESRLALIESANKIMLEINPGSPAYKTIDELCAEVQRLRALEAVVLEAAADEAADEIALRSHPFQQSYRKFPFFRGDIS